MNSMEKQLSPSDKDSSMDLIRGLYKKEEAVQLLGALVQQKIKFLEESIAAEMLEEDIRHREKRIQELQHDWKRLRERILQATDRIDINTFAEVKF